MLQTEFCNTLRHQIFLFLLMAATREAVLFMVLLYSIRGTVFDVHWMPRENTHILNCLCIQKYMLCNKTENHIKIPVHLLLFLTRFSRNDLLSTESDHIPSLQSLLWAKRTSVPHSSTVFGESSDKHLFKDDRFSYNLLPYWITLDNVNINNYIISLQSSRVNS